MTAGVARTYELRVTAKQQFEMGQRLMLRDPHPEEMQSPWRPWWAQKGPQGVPLELDVTPEEFESVDVGDVFVVRVSGPHS
jgi:hypothetical protein